MRTAVWVMATVGVAMMATGALAADYAGPRHHGYRHGGLRGVIGTCVRTRIAAIGPATPADASPLIRYRDGVIQAYDADSLGHTESRPGDPIQLCLVSFTRDCGEADLPGRTYATGNLRTGAAWTLPDVRSSCVVR